MYFQGINNEKSQFLNSNINKFDESYKIIEVEIAAGSFLYKMIRKLVGAAVDVANGVIELEQIEKMMLCPPDYYLGPDQTTVLKPNGLFLQKVHYLPEDFLRQE